MTYDKGNVLIVTKGEYFDYKILGYYRILDSFDEDKEFKRFCATETKFVFLEWLIDEGFIGRITDNSVKELWVDEYRRDA